LHYAGGAELLLLEGAFEDETGSFAAGTWLRLPVGAAHTPSTRSGCVLYVKEGGLAYLRPS
jgi:anti-sigma factor ChrR (cupin superfamily)